MTEKEKAVIEAARQFRKWANRVTAAGVIAAPVVADLLKAVEALDAPEPPANPHPMPWGILRCGFGHDVRDADGKTVAICTGPENESRALRIVRAANLVAKVEQIVDQWMRLRIPSRKCMEEISVAIRSYDESEADE